MRYTIVGWNVGGRLIALFVGNCSFKGVDPIVIEVLFEYANKHECLITSRIW